MKVLLFVLTILLAVPALAQERPDRALEPERVVELSAEDRTQLDAFLANRTHTVLAARPADSPRRTPQPPTYRGGAVVFTINSAYDDGVDSSPGDGVCAGPFGECQLRSALQEAEALANPETIIEFGITGGPAGSEVAPDVWRITLNYDGNANGIADQLPVFLATNLTINGLTQPGASCGTLVAGVKHDLRVILDGSNTTGGSAFVQEVQPFTLRGLVIQNFDGFGVRSFLNPNALVECNYIGTDYTGEVAAGNVIGIQIEGTARNNLVSGNALRGIELHKLSKFDQAVRVENNLIGTDADGNQRLGNGSDGIVVDRIDSEAVVRGNVISANGASGAKLTTLFGSSATGVSFYGNYVGLSRTGQSLGLGNQSIGVYVAPGTYDNDIGVPGEAPNYISDNGGTSYSGVRVDGSDGNRIRNNIVGLDASGNAAPNGFCGIITSDFGGSASDTVIGGPTPNERNIVGSNPINGICLGNDIGSLVEGNTVGLNAAGAARPNGGGINVFLSTGAVIRGNVASGNTGRGISVSTVATGVLIEDNIVGLVNNGITPSGNGSEGIYIFGSEGITMQGNTISANGAAGVVLAGNSSDITLTGNNIGTRSTGTGDRGNAADGIIVEHASDVRIGGTSAGEGNIIAFNGGASSDGVFIRPELSSRIALLRNEIHGNEGLGIDYCPSFPSCDNVTPNDSPDADGIPNYPVITSATNDGTNAVITATLNARPNQQYRIELFRSSNPDPSGHGEGRTFISNRSVTTNGSGSATTTFTRPASDLTVGTWATLTATVKNGTVFEATSELSEAAQVKAPAPPLVVTITPTSPAPPVVVQRGDDAFFDVTFEVGASGPSSFEFWTEAVLPNGSVRSPLLGPNTVNVSPPATVTLSFSQRVPNVAPFGDYTYRVEAGTFPSGVLDSDSFAAEIVPGRANDGPEDWQAFDAAGMLLDGPQRYDFRTDETETAEAASSEALPTEASLTGAYPNPFRRSTTVAFALPEAQRVTLTVYDVLGREVAVLLDGEAEAGSHEAVLDGSRLPSGVYLVRLVAGSNVQTQRLTRVR